MILEFGFIPFFFIWKCAYKYNKESYLGSIA